MKKIIEENIIQCFLGSKGSNEKLLPCPEMSSSQILTSSAFSLVLWANCSLMDDRAISSFLSKAFSFVTSIEWSRVRDSSFLLALKTEGDRLNFQKNKIYFHFLAKLYCFSVI